MRSLAPFALIVFLLAPSPAGAQARPADANQQFALGQRLGIDDGFALVLDVSGDIQGDLAPCGCNPPLGGLARRTAYTKMLSEQARGEAAIVSADAGFLFEAASEKDEFGHDPMIRNTWVLKAYEGAGIDVANISYRDLAFLERMQAAANHKANLATYPFLGRLVSTNVEPIDGSIAPFQPYVVVEAKAKRLGPKPLRIGFLGVSQEIPPQLLNGSSAVDFPVSKKFKVNDAVASVKRHLPELRKKVDLVVLLAYMPVVEAQALGKQVPGLDIIVASNLIAQQFPAQEAGDAVVVNVFQQTKYLTEMKLYADPQKPGSIASYAQRHVRLDSVIPDDPDAAKLVASAIEAFTKATSGPPREPVHDHDH